MVIIYSAAYVVRKKNIIRHMNNVFKSAVENLSQLAVTDKVKSHILNTQGWMFQACMFFVHLSFLC